MKCPSKIKVCNSTITTGTKPVNDPDNAGGLYLSENYLFYNLKQCKEQQRLSVLHELLHAIINYSGLYTIMNLNQQQEETIVRVLEPALYGLLRDNPQLVKFLTEKD